ncbi:MAG: hypothetical protein WCC06_06400 [Candidatus Aminicenantales bacterium]
MILFISCKKQAEPTEAASVESPVQEGLIIKEGLNEFTGTVKIGYGRYFYLPSAQGFDIGLQGNLENGDASWLTGKEVKVKAVFSRNMHSLLIAESIDLNEGAAGWKNIYTKKEDLAFEDYFNQEKRQEFEALKITNINKTADWEGKEKAKVFGQLVTAPPAQGSEQKGSLFIVVSDEKGKEIGRIIIDNVTDYANYYIKKLRLFDKFWFYINVKETVDNRVRRRTKELFHAEVLFAGLY